MPTTHHLTHLATLSPPAPARAWQSAPHPYLPLLATAAADRAVRIYSLTSFTLLSTISGGHTRSVRSVAWKPGVRGGEPGGSTLATGSFDASAGIWRGGPGEGGMEREVRHGDEEDGGDGDDGEDDYRFAVLLDGHDSEIKSVAWSAHGGFLATCSRDKSVWVWELLDGGAEDEFETVAVLTEHAGDVKCVEWHPADEGCLASGSYDEGVRVWREDADGEWVCVAVLEGHDGTVWSIQWEPVGGEGWEAGMKGEEAGEAVSGPRIMSCSDDLSIRTWRRTPKARAAASGGDGPRVRSIIRSTSDEEDWYEEERLPQGHTRAIYAIAWSQRTRRVVSCGSDGKIVVYEEREKKMDDEDTKMSNHEDSPNETVESAIPAGLKTEWIIIAEIEAAHGVYEVNHVCWARRADKGKVNDTEEVILSTGDDGEVKAWTIDL